jgi:pimeloyl-ACP methyl ester carboxylesterase
VKVDGVELECEEIAGAEPALVFLHEGLGAVTLWRDFPARLAAETGRRALLYSRAGHGRSDVPDAPRTPRFMHDEALAVLPALLEASGIVAPVLVGHSDGGSIALIHASSHPVSGLVLLAPHVFVEEVSVTSIAEARQAFETTDLSSRMARYHRDAEATFRLWNDIWLAPEFRDWNIEDVLGGVTAPGLLIQGEHDQYGTLAQLDAIERGVSGPMERVVLDCRHAPHLEAPEETLAAAAAFVRGLA